MNFNDYSFLKGQHAIFSPSSYHWINYTPEKISEAIHSRYRKTLGTEIHEVAASEIMLRHKESSIKNIKNMIEYHIYNKYCSDPRKQSEIALGTELLKELGYLPGEVFDTVKQYINDAVGYKMDSEVVLAYDSEFFFGTADAISFKNNLLRIHDLKTGSIPAHMEQLDIYAALFCLQHNVKPGSIEMELRIYQNAEVLYFTPTVEDIAPIMDKITMFTKYLTTQKKAEE